MQAQAPGFSRFQPQLRAYFLGEEQESWLFVGIGLLALFGGAWAVFRGSAFWKGAAWPLMAFGAAAMSG